MAGVFAVFVAAAAIAAPPTLNPQRLPQLPAQGLVHTTTAGVQLETLKGRPLGLLRGLRLSQVLGAHGGLLQSADGDQFFVIDPKARRLRRVDPFKGSAPKGCKFTDVGKHTRLYVCGPVLKTVTGKRVSVVARGPGPIGHWAWADLSPDEHVILGQWSAECESPEAFLIAGGMKRQFGTSSTTESLALGWLGSRRAVVQFPFGACGSGMGVPGVYVVPQSSKPQLLRPVSGRGATWTWGMWGGG
jgi:hypothetical protein